MKTQVDERVNVNLRAFDWFLFVPSKEYPYQKDV